MKQFQNQDIINYYDQTEDHFKIWWKLDESKGLHYGIWENDTRTLAQAIINTNRILAEMGGLKQAHNILDAGCGVGGTAIYLAKQMGCKVTGITLSERQVKRANQYAAALSLNDKVNFRVEDFTETSFENESFDAVIAIESMSSAPDKKLFLNEMRRILKPKGNILIADLFKSYAFAIDEFPVMNTMLNGWAIADLLTMNESQQIFADSGFHIVLDRDVTREIEPTVRKTYYACMLGALPTWLYQLTHNASYYSKNHYKTGIAQYKAYKKSLWNYHLLCLEKT